VKKQFYSINVVLETEARVPDVLQRVVSRALNQYAYLDSEIYGIDITPIDIEDNQFKWIKQLKSLNEL
jgi:hypothetical protein